MKQKKKKKIAPFIMIFFFFLSKNNLFDGSNKLRGTRRISIRLF